MLKVVSAAVLLFFVFLFCFPLFSTFALDTSGKGQIINCRKGVNVRSGPGTKYKIIGTAPVKTYYSITGKTGSWYKINFKGRTGYILSAYIKVSPNTKAAQTVYNQKGKIANCKNWINVRKGPGTRYSKLGTALKGAVYTIKGKSGKYYAIDYKGKKGYVHSDYIFLIPALKTPAAPSSPSPAPTLAPSPVPSPTAEPSPAPSLTPQPSPKPAPLQTPVPAPAGKAMIVGYYASWAVYSGYTPNRIPANVTHVNYAFADIGEDLKIKMGDASVDPANFDKLKQLKQQRPSLKTLISVGGWTWSGKFSDIALTDASRTAFAQSAVDFMKQHGFDGVDIDWEYPVGGGLPTNISRTEDKANFTLLMAKLREKLDMQGALDGRHYLLSFAGASGTFFARNTELAHLANYVDFATIMTYDMHGPWPDSLTGFNAPLYTPSENSPQAKWSCNAAVKLWTAEGFPKAKIIMGIPFYGIMFNQVTNAGKGLYQTFVSGSSVAYDKVAAMYLNNPAYTRYIHEDALVPWLFNGSAFISYDDPQSIAAKAGYIRDTGLGGAAIWELSQNADGALVQVIYANMR